VRIYQVCAALAENLPLDKLTSRLDSRLEFNNLAALAHPCYDSRYSVRGARCAMCDARYRSLSSVLFWLDLASPASSVCSCVPRICGLWGWAGLHPTLIGVSRFCNGLSDSQSRPPALRFVGGGVGWLLMGKGYRYLNSRAGTRLPTASQSLPGQRSDAEAKFGCPSSSL